MSGGEWLDAPDGDGHYWMYGPEVHDLCSVTIYGQTVLYGGRGGEETLSSCLGSKWQRIPEPTPPSPPLPKSCMVEMTARVTKTSEGRGLAEVFLRGVNNKDTVSRWSSMPWTMDDSAQWVRDSYGIEPEVSE